MRHIPILLAGTSEEPYSAECECSWHYSARMLSDTIAAAREHAELELLEPSEFGCELAESMGRMAQDLCHAAGRHSAIVVDHDHGEDSGEIRIVIRIREKIGIEI